MTVCQLDSKVTGILVIHHDIIECRSMRCQIIQSCRQPLNFSSVHAEMDDFTIERHISNIIVNSCISHPYQNPVHRLGFSYQFDLTTDGSDDKYYCKEISGSAAEFYIHPAIQCIGDIDLMCPLENYIAVFDEKDVTTLHTYNQEKLDVCIIETPEETWAKGYVYLKVLGGIIFNLGKERFEYCRYESNNPYEPMYNKVCMTNDHQNFQRKGPAYVKTNTRIFSIDMVACIRCPSWPPSAQAWVSRNRNYTWPCDAIVSEVQRNGCDVVNVSHRDNRQNEELWRISFSRAEVTLIRSWTPTQQIVYHMLRYFAKRMIFQDDANNEANIICTYHIKTLMLWACERKSPDWWESLCVLDICSRLLVTLTNWILEVQCPHYFIPEWNLLDYKMSIAKYDEAIETLQMFSNLGTLAEWFKVNYVSKMFLEFVATTDIAQLQLELNADRYDDTLYSALQMFFEAACLGSLVRLERATRSWSI